VSGNVSLYNETAGRPVYPTPVIGMLGLLEDVSRHLQSGFREEGSAVYLIGAGVEQEAASLSGSEFLESEHGRVAGLPRVDLAAEARLQQLTLRLAGDGLLRSAHDCADGGLAVTVAESCMIGGRGFAGDAEVPGRLDAALFGEAQGRIVISLAPDAEGRVTELAREYGVPATRLGRTTGDDAFTFGPVRTTVGALKAAWESLVD
jgi:phosphoribosylformylglycinamidine synthase